VMVQKAGMAMEADEDPDPETPQPKRGKPKTFTETVKALNNSAFPSKYGNPTTSGLTFTVKDGPNQLELDLKSR